MEISPTTQPNSTKRTVTTTTNDITISFPKPDITKLWSENTSRKCYSDRRSFDSDSDQLQWSHPIGRVQIDGSRVDSQACTKDGVFNTIEAQSDADTTTSNDGYVELEEGANHRRILPRSITTKQSDPDSKTE